MILKGGLAYLGPDAQSVQSVEFQFNPETLTRLQSYSEQTNTITESIRFELVLSAMEDLEQEVPAVVENGIYPQLAALEEILVHQTKQQRSDRPEWLFPARSTSFLVFIYGERIIPVKIQRLNVKELLHNNQLKPIYAKVDVALRVLTKRDLRGNAAGLNALDRYQQYRRLKAQQTEMGNL